MKLTMQSGPRLLLHRDGAGEEDVTSRAVEYLFENISLNPDITLGDLLHLFDVCPGLHLVYKRWFSEELCAHARRGSRLGDYGLLRIQLSPAWELDSYRREYANVMMLNVCGLGVVPDDGYEYWAVSNDGFVHYALSGCDVRSLLMLPVHCNNQVEVWEQDSHSINDHHVIQRHTCNDLQLGVILNAILHELTWFGVVDTDAEDIEDEDEDEELEVDFVEKPADPEWEKYFADINSGCFGWSDPRAWAQFFASMGSFSKPQLVAAIRRIPDGCKAASWLARSLGRDVVIRRVYRISLYTSPSIGMGYAAHLIA